MVCCCQDEREGRRENKMGQAKKPSVRSLESLRRATDVLSTMVAQEIKELNARQKQARKNGTAATSAIRELKEATAVLKDLAAVAKTLNEQGTEVTDAVCGVVLLPRAEEEGKE